MRICILLLICSIAQVFGVSTYSQNANLTLQLKNVSVEEVLNKIEEQSEFRFLYNKKMVNVTRKVDVSARNERVTDVLNKLFANEDVSYAIRDRQIVLRSKESARQNQAGDIEVKGQVLDINKDPMPGVSVQVKSTMQGTITNLDGEFSIKVPDNKSVLLFTFVGYLDEEVKVGSRNFITLIMKEDVRLLDEIVVMGYGTMKKSDVNAAIVSVKGEDLVKTGTSSVTQMLSGKAAGVTVFDNSTQPGGGSSILIRGAGSVGAGNEPLYVIDGFPISNDNVEPRSGNRYDMGSRNILNTINPNDIASIEILKDASATAIYGARGCNGVILITTKRGTGNKTKVEYNGDYSIQTIAKRPEMLSWKDLKTETNRYMYEEYLMRYKIAPYGTRDPSTVSPFKPRYSDEDIAATGAGTDWYDEITQTGEISQHNLSLNSGSENTRMMLSLNYYDQKGVVKTSGMKRLTARLNLDQKLSSWFDYGFSLSGARVDNRNAAIGGGTNENSGIIQSALQYNPGIAPERDENGEYILNPNQALIPNPLSFLDITDNTLDKRWLLNAFANVHINKDMFVKLATGFDDERGTRKNYLPKTFMYGKGQNGVANINDVTKTDILTEATFNYHKLWKKIHDFNFVAGTSYQEFNKEGTILYAYDFFTDAFKYNKLSVGEGLAGVDSDRSKYRMVSYFGRLQYNLKGKYLFTFTARSDGSDRFGENNRYGFFPSGAFAWRMVEEDFMRNQQIVSDLKLRLSIGQTGNANIGNTAYEYYEAQGRNYYFNGKENTGVNLSQIANPNLKWETTTEYNLGVDYGFFQNRISGNVELYYKEIKDLLGWQSLMSNSVLSGYPSNIGKTQSKGLEVTLATINVIRPFRWNTTLTYTAYRDNWLERSPDNISKMKPYESMKDPLTAVYAFLPDGIIQEGEVVAHMPQAKPGMMKIKDIDGLGPDGKKTGQPDGIINSADMVYIGKNSPDFTLGMNNTFSYKGFDLSCFIYASYGAMRWSHVNYAYGTDFEILKIKDGNNYLASIKDRWASDNQTSTMPSGVRNPYLLDGHYAHEKAAYIRMKNLSLGYDFSPIVGLKQISNMRLSFSVQNVFTITDFSGIDPEVEGNSAPYPLQRTYSVGLNLSF